MNPYQYKGPLDPVKNEIVCIPRWDDLNRVIEGIKRGDYWNILGPRQIGKTTFLRQIQKEFKDANYIFFDFQVPHKTEEFCYQKLMDDINTEISSQKVQIKSKRNLDPSHVFLDFLEKFKPREDKKIILLFDEIEGIPFLKDFLNIWRTVYESRYRKKQLNRYVVITAGSAALIPITIGPTSPFDIAENLYMKDLSDEECERLIDEPFEKLEIKIDSKAREKLISQISGHPQLLQYACYNLVHTALKKKREIVEKDIDETIKILLKENVTIDTLRADVKEDSELEKLIRDILKGEKKKYHPYKEFSIKGAGCIVEDENALCAIRNEVYERFLRDIVESFKDDSGFLEGIESITKKYKEGDFIEDNSSKKYIIFEKVGKGGMGVVFKAKAVGLRRIVALKMLNSKMLGDKENLKRFINEARTAAQLDHTNIVKVYDFGKVKGDYFISMEFIEGEDLLTKINNFQDFTYMHIFYISKELLKALHYSHKKRIVHRDVKPQNIMISVEGDIKVVDFGLAVIRDRHVKVETGPIIGTPYYMAPEQFERKKVDPRTDIYSTGVTLFHLLSGTLPFKGEDIPRKHLEEPVPIEKIGKGVPRELVKIIEKCMEKDRKNRYQSVEELLKKIEELEKKIIGRAVTKEDIKDIVSPDNETVMLLETTEQEK
jgi:serine/threonine-protein kinase